MNPKIFWLITAILLVYVPHVGAQQSAKIPRIGWLDSSTLSGNAGLLEAFWQEMRKLGWVQGKNIAIEYRFAENKGTERVSALAAELVRLHVDLIVASGAAERCGAKRDEDHPHRDGERFGPCSCRLGR